MKTLAFASKRIVCRVDNIKMNQFWFLTIFAVILAALLSVQAEEDIVNKQVDTDEEPVALIDLDAGVKGDGDLVREARQFGFGYPGFYRPRPFYGGGFYRPRPYYGGGFYRPRPFYGPRPYYGGFYG